MFRLLCCVLLRHLNLMSCAVAIVESADNELPPAIIEVCRLVQQVKRSLVKVSFILPKVMFSVLY